MPSEVSPSPAMSQRIFSAADMAERIRAFAWETTSLGPISTWNYTLLASVNMMLGMQFPTMMLWGAGDGVPLQRCLRPFDHQSPPWRTRQRLRLLNILQQAPVFFALLEGPEIRQVLNNLAVNAIDAMPTGGRLLLRSRDIAPGIVLTVADTGGGIAPENLRRIFEPFYTTKGIGGTGLGLWLSHDIIMRHRGVLRVRSSKASGHSGTVFTLYLPIDASPNT